MKIGFAATAAFGAQVLERVAVREEVAFLLTRPDRPAGRGRRPTPPPARAPAARLGRPGRGGPPPTPPPARVVAERFGIPVLDEYEPSEVDTIVLVAYGRLIPAELLDRHLWLNVHPSLLPRWRGAAPVERAIMAGDRETGVTLIRLVEEVDAGPIAAQRAFPIRPDDDAGAVYARSVEIADELLAEVLPEPTFRPQPDEGTTYAEKITPADRALDWSRPARELVDRVRALSPHIGARGELHGRAVLIWRARVEDGRFVPVEVQPEGGRRMRYEAWLRGLR